MTRSLFPCLHLLLCVCLVVQGQDGDGRGVAGSGHAILEAPMWDGAQAQSDIRFSPALAAIVDLRCFASLDTNVGLRFAPSNLRLTTVAFRSNLPETPFATRRQGGYIILNHGPNAKPRTNKPNQPIPRIDWNAKPDLEDFKITNPAWVAETFDRLKGKPKTLGEITGLVFPIEKQD